MQNLYSLTQSPVSVVSRVVSCVRRAQYQTNNASFELLAHFSDGVVKHATRVVCAFTNQFHLQYQALDKRQRKRVGVANGSLTIRREVQEMQRGGSQQCALVFEETRSEIEGAK